MVGQAGGMAGVADEAFWRLRGIPGGGAVLGVVNVVRARFSRTVRERCSCTFVVNGSWPDGREVLVSMCS